MTEPAVRSNGISFVRALGWWAQGLWFWKSAPLRVAFWSLLPLACEALLQAVPVVGIVASKLVVPLVSGLALLAFDRIVNRRNVEMTELVSDLRRVGPVGLAGLVAVAFAVYLLQLATGYLIYSEGAIDLLLWGDAAAQPELVADRRLFLTLVLTALALGMLLLFFAPLVVLQRAHPTAALSLSAATMLAAPVALLLTYALSALLFAAALTWGYGLGLLIVVPLLSAVYFMAYRDVFVARATRAAES